MKKSGEKTETFSASALAVGTPKACYPSSTQPGPEGVPSQFVLSTDQIRGPLVDYTRLWTVARHNTLSVFLDFWFVWVRVLQ